MSQSISHAQRDQAILQSIADAVIAIDTKDRIFLFNKAASKLTGFTSKQAIGKDYKTVLKFSQESKKKINCSFIKKAFKGSVSPSGPKTEIIKKDGSRLAVLPTASAIKNSKGKINGVVVIFSDVTLEREIDKRKSEFISITSHQFRTPLSTIRWYIEALIQGSGGIRRPAEDQIEPLGTIYENVMRMVNLINTLLNVTRLDMGKFMVEPQQASIIEVANDSIRQIKPQFIQKNIKILTEFDKTIPSIPIDVHILDIVFQNLLSNSIKYTPKSGKINFIINKTDSKNILIKIKDNGVGIPDNQKNRIFTKLFRADNAKEIDSEGTGLGLYIVKNVVEQTGGKVDFTSKEGQGTTFIITIPISGMKAKKADKKIERAID